MGKADHQRMPIDSGPQLDWQLLHVAGRAVSGWQKSLKCLGLNQLGGIQIAVVIAVMISDDKS